jgi:hypothetical protein
LGSLLRRWLGFSRTRLFIAVLVPCFIGASAAYRDGFFSPGYFTLMAFGLVMVESSNLLLADWATFGGGSKIGEAPPPMPGSPMLPQAILSTRRTVHASVVCLGIAVLTMLAFAAQRGIGILFLGAIAVAIGGFYVFSPVRYGFFSTALLPPIISLGAYFALSGTPSVWTVLSGLPNMFLSACCIFTYRVLYGKGGSERFAFRVRVLLGLYLFGFATLAASVFTGLLPAGASAGLLAAPLIIPLRTTLRNRSDYVPATSVGVAVYATTGLLIAFGSAFL